MTKRAPTIRAQSFPVRDDSGKVIGSVDIPLIDPREHSLWMQTVETVESNEVTNKILGPTNKFGGTNNYTMFEADGTPVAVGDATTFDDSQAAVIYMRSGGTALTLDSLSGGIYAYRLDKNDEIHSQIQTTHKYKIGSPIYFHIHLLNKNAVGASNYNVGIQLEWAWAGLFGVMPAAVTETTVDCSFQNASALMHKVFEIATITPTVAQSTISSILFFRVKRVTATSNDYTGTDIFLAGIDFHNEMDTPGSRGEYSK